MPARRHPYFCVLRGVSVFQATSDVNTSSFEPGNEISCLRSSSRGLEPLADAFSTNYFVSYDSHEFLYPGSAKLPDPFWARTPENSASLPGFKVSPWPGLNYETGQPPLYYAIAGLWWRIGEACGWRGGHLLYWLRFLNILLVSALVWVGYLAARTVFPENAFLRTGVPALLVFFPQTAFYSIENDVLSPLCFGAAFILLVNFLRAETPEIGLGLATGLMLAATFLVKMTNLPLLALSALVVLIKIGSLLQSGRFRLAAPSVLALALCAGLPILAWMAWCWQACFRRLHGLRGKNPIPWLDTQAVRRMVASPHFYLEWRMDIFVATHPHFLAGGILVALPAAQLSGDGGRLYHHLHLLYHPGGGGAPFAAHRWDPLTASGPLAWPWDLGCDGGLSRFCFHHLRFP